MKNRAENWILYAVAAAFFWGCWGVVAKLISRQVSPFTNHVLFSVGMLLTLPLVLKKVRTTGPRQVGPPQARPNRKGILWGLVAGVLAVAGNVAVYKAFSVGGLAAIVIPVTNLYPLVTIAIALLVFRERLNRINVIGILLAIPAVVMLSGESLLFDNPAAFIRHIGLNAWLLYALVALLFWGIFSAAQKETTNHISAEWSYVSFIMSSVFIAFLFLVFGWAETAMSGKTLMLGSLAGMLNGLGVLASFAAYSAEGKASKVTTIAGALQPVFTIILALIFLSESLSFIELGGIVLAIIGALTLSYEAKKNGTFHPNPGLTPPETYMNAILNEILEIPVRANEVLNSPVDPLPLHVPYLGMGSSYFAPLAFKYMGLPIFPELASEYYYYLAQGKKAPLAVILSQSGRSSEALWCRDLFEQYVAVSNDTSSDLCTAPNVARVLPIRAGGEHYSSSKTYVNTLIALFKGFGLSPNASVALLADCFGQYREQGEQLADAVFVLLSQQPIHGLYVTGSGPNIATACEAALILSESTRLNVHGLPMAQYDHGPKETARNSIVIQILAGGPADGRTRRLSETVARAGAHVFTVEAPTRSTNARSAVARSAVAVAEPYSILHTIIPFNFMAYFLALKLGVSDTFVVGGKVTEAS